MGEWPFWAVATEEQRARWMEAFGADRVPIKSPVATRALLPGLGETLVYEVEISRLDASSVERLAHSLARRFRLPRKEVEAGLRAAGCPIVATHCSVVMYQAQRWL